MITTPHLHLSKNSMNLDIHKLTIPVEPWILRSALAVPQLKRELAAKNLLGLRLIELDGSRMKNVSELYDEISSRLKLPGYFGRNLNALSECLTDSDLLEGTGFIFFITSGESLLVESEPKVLKGFIDTIYAVCREWAMPVDSGQAWDRPATPFHVIIQCADAPESRFHFLPRLS